MERKYLLLITLVLMGCGSSNNSSNSSKVSNSSSKSSLTYLSTSTSSKDEKISKDFVVNKLSETINKSYTLNYSFENIVYNDVYVPNLYYYNDLYNSGSLLANLYGNNIFAYDFNIEENEVNITNQSYGMNGLQGQTSLGYASLGLNDYDDLINYLEVTDIGVKLSEKTYINMLTYAINDSNSFDYIIFNKVDDNLTFEFYYQDQVYDGYSYVLKDIGSTSFKIIDEYLAKESKFKDNGLLAKDTFKVDKKTIQGDISYDSLLGFNEWEEIKNTRIENNAGVNYELVSTSNDVSYRQLFTKNSQDEIYKIGLNGKNEMINSLTELKEEELFPQELEFLKDTFLLDSKTGTYIYLGNNSNGVISYLLPNMSSIVTDAWVTQIQFIIKDNQITSFIFETDYYALENNSGYFIGLFNVTNDGNINDSISIEADGEEVEINKLFNKLIGEDANYTIESNSYGEENGALILLNEKHVINYVNNVYFDANYRINNDKSLTMQFANGYTVHNEIVYSFRYDAINKVIDNVKETSFTSIGEAILSLGAEVLDFEGSNILKINKNVTEIKDNVGMLEQAGLIDPSTLKFHLNSDLDSIEKIVYKYGNAYTSAYVEAKVSYGNALIETTILEDLKNKLPKDLEVEEFYMKDSDNDTVLEIYGYLKDEYLGEKADYIPYIPGIEGAIDVIWLNDYPEGYQYLMSIAPSDYLDTFKLALESIYGYIKINETTYVNNKTGLEIEIQIDMGYVQIYITSI